MVQEGVLVQLEGNFETGRPLLLDSILTARD